MTEFSLTEQMLLRRFEAAVAAPESYVPAACTSRSHSPDGWHCAVEGEHIVHANAAQTSAW